MGRRHAGDGGLFDAAVAIAAIKPEAADMMLVAKGYGLVDSERYGPSRIPKR